LGELALDGTEEVDVLAVRRGDVSQDLIIDAAPGPAHRLHRQPVVFRRPGHYGVGDQREAPGLLGLLLQVAGTDRALVGVEQVPLQRVQRLSLVELPGDLAPVGVPVALKKFPTDIPLTCDNEGSADRR
jgi:hypothetical protein